MTDNSYINLVQYHGLEYPIRGTRTACYYRGWGAFTWALEGDSDRALYLAHLFSIHYQTDKQPH